VITNYVSDYISLLVRIAHIICNHPLFLSLWVYRYTAHVYRTIEMHTRTFVWTRPSFFRYLDCESELAVQKGQSPTELKHCTSTVVAGRLFAALRGYVLVIWVTDLLTNESVSGN